MSLSPSLKCPVCNARFRQNARCSRCGTDLTSLMRVAARAYAARQACRDALRAGNLSAALSHSAAATRLMRSNADHTPTA